MRILAGPNGRPEAYEPRMRVIGRGEGRMAEFSRERTLRPECDPRIAEQDAGSAAGGARCSEHVTVAVRPAEPARGNIRMVPTKMPGVSCGTTRTRSWCRTSTCWARSPGGVG